MPQRRWMYLSACFAIVAACEDPALEIDTTTEADSRSADASTDDTATASPETTVASSEDTAGETTPETGTQAEVTPPDQCAEGCDDGDLCTDDACDEATGTCVHEVDAACVGTCQAGSASRLDLVVPGHDANVVATVRAGVFDSAWDCSGEASSTCTRKAEMEVRDATGTATLRVDHDPRLAPSCTLTCGDTATVNCKPLIAGVTYVIDALVVARAGPETTGALRLHGFCLATTPTALAGAYTATFDNATGGTASFGVDLAATGDNGISLVMRNAPNCDPNVGPCDFDHVPGQLAMSAVLGDGFVDVTLTSTMGKPLAHGRLYARASWLVGHLATLDPASGLAPEGVMFTLMREAPAMAVPVDACSQ